MSLAFNIFSSNLEREKENQFSIVLPKPIDLTENHTVGVRCFQTEKTYLDDVAVSVSFTPERYSNKIEFKEFIEKICEGVRYLPFYFSEEYFKEFNTDYKTLMNKFVKRKIKKNSTVFSVVSHTSDSFHTHQMFDKFEYVFEYAQPYTIKEIFIELHHQIYEQMKRNIDTFKESLVQHIMQELYFNFTMLLKNNLFNLQDVDYSTTVIKANFVQPSFFNSALEKILHIYVPGKEIINIYHQAVDNCPLTKMVFSFFNEKNQPIPIHTNFFLQFEFKKVK